MEIEDLVEHMLDLVNAVHTDCCFEGGKYGGDVEHWDYLLEELIKLRDSLNQNESTNEDGGRHIQLNFSDSTNVKEKFG